MREKVRCPKCTSDKLKRMPVKYQDGSISEDSEDAKCDNCGHEFTIVYI